MRTTLLVASLVLAAIVPSAPVRAQSAQDKAIAQEIGQQLKSSGQLHDYRIGVKYKDGIAALSGTVASQQQLSMAIRLTRQMPGIEKVVNNLSIAGNESSGGTNSLAKPPQQMASRASYEGTGPQSAPATRTSYQPGSGAQPMYGPGMNPASGMNPRMAMAQRPTGASRMPAQGRGNMPLPMGGRPPVQQAGAQQPMQAMQAGCNCGPGGMGGPPAAMGYVPGGMSGAVNYDNAQMPGYAWPSYASYPNYAALTYPQQYSPTAWPYIGPFYPYPQVPLGWRKVALEWDDGWWFLDFSDCGSNY